MTEQVIPDDPQLQALLTRADEIRTRLDDAKKSGDGLAELQGDMATVKAAINDWQKTENTKKAEADYAALIADVDALKAASRAPSKAALIGFGSSDVGNDAAFAERFFATLAKAQSGGKLADPTTKAAALAELDAHGVTWTDVDPAAKATVGDTNAAGGYLVPNPIVTAIDEQATAGRNVVDLFEVINGVRGSGVQIPWEQETISRAVIAAAGATKENSDFIVNAYTATLYTLARIFDVGNQLLRQSEGAAERLVRSKLARAFALGEDYYAIQGSGSSQPYGLLTAIGTSGTYVSTFSSPSDSTVAGSVISAVITAAGALANRGAEPDGVVLNSADFYEMLRQGKDEAGFWRDPFSTIAPLAGTSVPGPVGLRWRHTPNMPTDSLVVGEYKSAMFFRGQGYRVDTSDQAGTRWDKNETGFRGEEEIAFDARPSVYTGRFQRITNAVP